MTSERKMKTPGTALDGLSYGTQESFAEGRIDRKIRVEGVTRGQIAKDVVGIAWPCLVELVLTQLTSIVDQMMVGQLPGQAGIMALSAVGLAGQPKLLLMTMVQAMNVGSTAVIARFRGQQDREKANQVYKQALILNLFVTFVFSIIGILAAEPMIRFMSGGGITEETLGYGVKYLNIQMYGFIPFGMALTTTAALRGVGDTRTPLIYNTVANLVNVALNYCLIYGHFGLPAMGVEGASLATILGQTTALFIAMTVILSKRKYIFLDFRKKMSFDREIMKSVLTIGIPSMMEQFIMRIGNIIYTRTVAGLGDTMYATHNVCMSIQAMSFMIGQAFASTATALMGQSIGKRRFDMAALYMKETRRVGLYLSVLTTIGLAVFNRQIVGMFNPTPEVVEMGGRILLLMAFMQPIQSEQFIVAGGLRGAGDTRYTALVVTITNLGVRTVLGIIAVKVLHTSLFGAWMAVVIDQVVRSALIVSHYNGGKWKKYAIPRAGSR